MTWIIAMFNFLFQKPDQSEFDEIKGNDGRYHSNLNKKCFGCD